MALSVRRSLLRAEPRPHKLTMSAAPAITTAKGSTTIVNIPPDTMLAASAATITIRSTSPSHMMSWIPAGDRDKHDAKPTILPDDSEQGDGWRLGVEDICEGGPTTPRGDCEGGRTGAPSGQLHPVLIQSGVRRWVGERPHGFRDWLRGH